MVIASIGGRDTCWGDSGGPVLEPFAETWRLIAITSRPTLHGGASCGRGGIYIRIDVIDAWLTQALKETS
jgi:secreted trypsin-like serine protease